MNRALIVVIAVVALFILSLLGGAFFVVDETQQVVITRFGQPIREPVTEPGLNVKAPFVDKANYFDKRFLEWDGDPNQVPTRDKRFIYVDTYARWKITEPLKYLERMRTELRALGRLSDILDGETRNVVAKHDLIEVVRNSNREFAASEEVETAAGEFARIEKGRSKLAEEVLASARTRTEDLGIEILDFRFKRLNYVEEVQQEVFNRMISERKRIAEQFRSEGAGEAARISGTKERELKQITSEAYRQAQEIKGRSDAEAADIYAEAYNRDSEFYRFLKTMEVFRQTLDGDTVLVLSTDGDLLRYLDRAK